jgi:hypothetical protein
MPDPKKAVIPGKIKKLVLMKPVPVKTGNGDEYFLIFTRNPLLPQNPLEAEHSNTQINTQNQFYLTF